ncbi:hypothetical protein RLEG12_13300 [Rhizobium leguminosarum bv. trifolii CB782]|nr:hypothetical protein RLEG12_13300 [Rhizobium leguminosarum bv. trifolii CB782]
MLIIEIANAPVAKRNLAVPGLALSTHPVAIAARYQ